MADKFAINKRLLPAYAATKARLEGRMLPTTMRLRFGATDYLSKNGAHAQRLAGWADQAQETYRELFDTHWKVMADSTLPDAGRLVRSAKHANKRIGTLQTAYDAALSAATGTLDNLSDRIHSTLKPPSNAGDLAQDSEIRAILRAETDPRKQMALARKFPRAVATMPAELSGVGEEGHTALTRDYLQATIPEVVAEFTETKAAVDAAQQAHKELTQGTREFIDFDRAALYAEHSFDPESQEAA